MTYTDSIEITKIWVRAIISIRARTAWMSLMQGLIIRWQLPGRMTINLLWNDWRLYIRMSIQMLRLIIKMWRGMSIIRNWSENWKKSAKRCRSGRRSSASQNTDGQRSQRTHIPRVRSRSASRILKRLLTCRLRQMKWRTSSSWRRMIEVSTRGLRRKGARCQIPSRRSNSRSRGTSWA